MRTSFEHLLHRLRLLLLADVAGGLERGELERPPQFRVVPEYRERRILHEFRLGARGEVGHAASGQRVRMINRSSVPCRTSVWSLNPSLL